MRIIVHSTVLLMTIMAVCCKSSLNDKQREVSPISRTGVDSTFNAEIIFELTKDSSIFSSFERDTIVIGYFDGQCSTCLAAFFNYLNKNKVNENYSYIYIAAAYDLELIEFYLEREKRNLKENEYLLYDSDNTFKHFNPQIKTELLPLITIDEKQRVISAISLYDFLIQ
jgi:hypothetical protein